MLRMLLVSYLFGIRSERRLCEEVVARCAAAELVAGRDVAVNGSTIMANASREKNLKGGKTADELRAGGKHITTRHRTYLFRFCD